MNPKNDEKLKTQDEIKLLDYWSIIKKSKRIILIFIIISLVLSIAFVSLMPRIYRGEIIMRLDPQEKYIAGSELADIISISSEKIREIFPEKVNIIEKVKLQSYKQSLDKFKVVVELRNSSDFFEIGNKFEKYLNNHPLFKKHSDEKKAMFIKSLENNASARAQLSKNKALVNRPDTIKYLNELRAEDDKLHNQINNLDPIQIISVNYNFNPVKPQPIPYILFSGIIGIILGIFFSLFLNFIVSAKVKTDSP